MIETTVSAQLGLYCGVMKNCTLTAAGQASESLWVELAGMEGRQKSWPLCLLDMYLLLDYNWTIAGARFTQCREVNRELRGQWQLLFYFGCVFENNIDQKKKNRKENNTDYIPNISPFLSSVIITSHQILAATSPPVFSASCLAPPSVNFPFNTQVIF